MNVLTLWVLLQNHSLALDHLEAVRVSKAAVDGNQSQNKREISSTSVTYTTSQLYLPRPICLKVKELKTNRATSFSAPS
ncbi:hypothetical protein GALMADRAFT_229432 [Galerina marginata CBS 339.88]|uniref:Secreted protein n=1 Tax=Galerina marginata (strain CBS 339.88) TaxID=685588 RepID=A0A067SXG7_GALM3|nr:hypothetical protein GALMADRAFT_229432 [Galerina marginata CBS 339.88]